MSQLRTGGPTEPAPAVAGRSRASILIVDDTPANLRLLSQMLAEQGYHARPVPDGPLALAAARADPPDLILLDIRMPEMDGYLVCEELKADARTRDIPVIFISALDATKDKVRAFQSGGVDYVTKPFQAAEVLARVDTHLSLRELQKELVDANERMAQELSLAGEVQASFLPLEPPTLAGWQVAATLQPARQASGDFYDFLSLPGGRLGIVMADVSDKGAGAALFMALSCTLIRTYAPQHSGQPERLLGAVNRRILSDTNACQFVTVFYGVLDRSCSECRTKTLARWQQRGLHWAYWRIGSGGADPLNSTPATCWSSTPTASPRHTTHRPRCLAKNACCRLCRPLLLRKPARGLRHTTSSMLF
jgi:sigma-B regulation protein RsbU (phosphoserine phosphatase)